MKIGIDLRAINESAIYRGIGTYVISLTNALSRIDKKNDYYLFLYDYQASFALEHLPHYSNWHFVFLKASPFRKKKFVRSLMIEKPSFDVDNYSLDVIYQLDMNFPIKNRGTPVVSIIYDLIPQIFPELYQPPIRIRRLSPGGLILFLKEHRLRRLMNFAAGKAHRTSEKVIVISEHTARDVIALAGISPSHVKAIPLAAEIRHNTTPTSRPNFLTPTQKYFLYAGGVDPRKQIPYLVEQFATSLVDYPGISLVIAGKEATDLSLPHARKLHRTIKETGTENSVILTGYIQNEELDYLYQNALAFVFPSRYEGFGLPILEAMAAGCPVVTYNNSSIPEVAGDAALLIPDGEPISPALNQIIDNKQLREKLVKRGKLQAKKFSWEKTAEQTLAVLVEAAKNK